MKKLLFLSSVIFILLVTFTLVKPAQASVTAGQANSVSLSSGLVGYWPLDGATTNWLTGTTRDLSGQGNNGSLVSMSTTTSTSLGKLGQAFQFITGAAGGSGPAYLNAVNIPGNSYRFTSSFTVAFWIKASPNWGSGYRGIIGMFDGATASGWDIGLNTPTGKVRMTLRGTTLLDNTGSFGPDLRDGKWHHVVFVNTLTSIQTYIDGVLVGTTNGTWVPVTNTQNLVLGNRGAGTSGMIGSIDDVRVYNRALSAAEVSQLYTLGTTNVAHSNNVTLSTGLVGYWPLDGATTNWSTQKTNDISGSGRHATIKGMSTTTTPTLGKIGQAFNFTGAATKALVISTIASPIVTGTTFTYSAWIYTSVTTNNGNNYAGLFENDGTSGIFYRMDLRQLSFYYLHPLQM